MTELSPAMKDAIQVKMKALKEVGLRKGWSGRKLRRWYERELMKWARKQYKGGEK